MKKTCALFAVTAAFLLAPSFARAAQPSQPIGVTASESLNETKVLLGNPTTTSWYVRIMKNGTQENRFLVMFYFPSGTSDFATGGIFRGNEATSYSKSAERIMALNVWKDHIYVGDENGNYTSIGAYLSTDCYTSITSSNVGFDMSIPMGASIKTLKVLAGTQIPTIGYATNGLEGSAGANDVFTIGRTTVYNLVPADDPSFATPTVNGLKAYENEALGFSLASDSIALTYVTKVSGGDRVTIGLNLDDSEYSTAWRDDRNDSMKLLNMWLDHIQIDGENAVPLGEPNRYIFSCNASKGISVFQFDVVVPDYKAIKQVTFKEGTQFPTYAYAREEDTSGHSMNEVYQVSETKTYKISYNSSTNRMNVMGFVADFSAQQFELLHNSVSCWYVKNYTSIRYALAFRIPDTYSDYDGTYVDLNDDRFKLLDLWNDQIYFILQDGTELAMTPFEAEMRRVMITVSRTFQIDFSLATSFDLSSIKGIRVKAGTQFPTLAFTKNEATSKYDANTVLETSRDAIFNVSQNPNYDNTKPGSAPFVFSDYQGYESSNSELDLSSTQFQLLKNGSQSNRYRLYFRVPQEMVDFDQVDKSIYPEGVVENTYISGLNWGRDHIYFDNEPAVGQTNHEGWASYGKVNVLGEISFDLNCALDGSTSMTILAGTQLPSLAFATGKGNDDNTDTTKVYAVKESMVVELTPNPEYTGNNASSPFLLSAVKKLSALKADAQAKLEAYDPSVYLEEDQEGVKKAIEDGKAAVSSAVTAKGVELALEEYEAKLNSFRTAEYYQELAASKEVVSKIDAIGEVTAESGAAIAEARRSYDALNEKAKALVGEDKLQTLLDAEARYTEIVETADAENVKSLIDQIGEVTLDSEEVIVAARAALDALSAGAYARIPSELIEKLVAAEARLSGLKQSKESSDVVISLIGQIGEVTLQSELAIVQARMAYDSLSAEAKAMISAETVQKLVDAENKIVQLKADQKAQDEASGVIDLINAIGDVTADSEETIAAARKSYDALSDAAKEKISPETLEILVSAEKKLEQLKTKGSTGNVGVVVAACLGAAVVVTGVVVVLLLKKKKQ